MTRARIAGLTAGAVLALMAVAAGFRAVNRDAHPVAKMSPAIASATMPAETDAPPAPESYQGLIYGRITTIDGATHEGRLRWGPDEEAFWGD
jgi:hypothetical protein